MYPENPLPNENGIITTFVRCKYVFILFKICTAWNKLSKYIPRQRNLWSDLGRKSTRFPNNADTIFEYIYYTPESTQENIMNIIFCHDQFKSLGKKQQQKKR